MRRWLKGCNARIVRQIASEHPQVEFNIQQNEQNLGYILNFQKAISLCKNEIVFLCDQDDVWREDKVETILAWFAEHPEKDAVFTNAELIDENGNRFTEKDLFYCWGFDEKAKEYFNDGYAFELFAIQNRATGATMAIRNANNLNCVDGWNGIPHDRVLAMQSLLRDGLGYIDLPLIGYRNHSSQQIGAASYLDNPFSNDIFDGYYDGEGIWEDTNLPEIRKEEIAFHNRQLGLQYRFFGPIIALLDIRQYKKLYVNRLHSFAYMRFLYADIRRSICHSLHRIKRFFCRKLSGVLP